MSKKREVGKSSTGRTRPVTPTKALEWKAWLQHVKEFFRCRSSSILPVFASKVHDSRPYINVDIFGVREKALVDTGANNSVLGNLGKYLIKKV